MRIICFEKLIFIHSDLTQSLFNIYSYRTFNKNMSVDDMEKYYEDDKFLYLVVEVADLIFGFDLTIDEEKEIAVKIVTQSYSVVGIDGKNVDVIIGGWKVARVLPTWIKDLKCWNQFLNNYVGEKEVVQENDEEEDEEEKEEKYKDKKKNSQVPKKNSKRNGSECSQVEKEIKGIKVKKKDSVHSFKAMGSRFNRSQKKDSVVKDDTKMAITMATAHQAGYYAHLILNWKNMWQRRIGRRQRQRQRQQIL